jgi:CheY-like chemotaxis protein
MKSRILLANDNKDAAEVISFVLNFLGYEVIVADDRIEAIVHAAMNLVISRLRSIGSSAIGFSLFNAGVSGRLRRTLANMQP